MIRARRSSPTPLALVDATAVPSDRGGVGRYVDALVTSLGEGSAIACQAADEPHYRRIAPHALVYPQPTWAARTLSRLVWEQILLPRVAREADAHVIHSPHYTIPLLTRIPRVVTFHDGTFFSDPQVHTPLKRWFFRTWAKISVRLAQAVIVPSEATGAEISRHLNVPLTRFDVAYHGVDRDVFFPPSKQEITDWAEGRGLEGRRWIAFLGTLEPRKNLPALVRAYSVVVERLISDHRPVPALLLIGGRGWETGLDRDLAKIAHPAEVIRMGFLPDRDLRAALGGAEVFVYPSLGEGFGLPVLEAMACGAPVITTRRLALPEVGGDAALYTEVDDGSIADSIVAALGDPDRLRASATAGITRASLFTWEASARTHWGVYRRASRA